MKIAIYGSRRHHELRQQTQSFLRNLSLAGAELCVDHKLYHHLSTELGITMTGIAEADKCPADADLAISLGGDGTFLRTVAWIGTLDIPVLGINTGHLGYLTALTLPEAITEVDRIMSLDFRIDRHTLLQVSADGLTGQCLALNEVVVSKEDSASMITASVNIDGHYLGDYKADGLIVATPTGSTAYNLSVGGPIVQPSAPVMVLSPIAAHSLTLRPLVVDDSAHISIAVHGRGHRFRLVLDEHYTSMPMDTEVQIYRAPHRVAIMQLPDRDFTQVLNSKLQFNS